MIFIKEKNPIRTINATSSRASERKALNISDAQIIIPNHVKLDQKNTSLRTIVTNERL